MRGGGLTWGRSLCFGGFLLCVVRGFGGDFFGQGVCLSLLHIGGFSDVFFQLRSGDAEQRLCFVFRLVGVRFG
jgi:hypothetical protein